MATLTAETRERFINLAQSIDEEGRDLPMGDFTNQMKGHITSMKKAGLVHTYRCDGDPQRILWLGLTKAGSEAYRQDAELEYDELVAALKDVLRIVHKDYGLRFYLKPEVKRARKALGGWGPNLEGNPHG